MKRTDLFGVHDEVEKLSRLKLNDDQDEFINILKKDLSKLDKENLVDSSVKLMKAHNLKTQAQKRHYIDSERDEETPKSLDDIIIMIEVQIGDSGSDRPYQKKLEEILHTLNAINSRITTQVDAGDLQITEKVNKQYALHVNTEKKFNGVVMLPMNQELDYRMASGACFGYSAYWSHQLLHSKPFFGTDAGKEPLFKAMSRKKTGVNHAYLTDVNHVANLTDKISKLQFLQHDTRDVSNELSNGGKETTYFSPQTWFFAKPFIKSAYSLAEQVITNADKHAENPCILTICGGLRGHAMSFCKKNDQYHFMDPNFGWVKFNDSENFKQWFVEYYTVSGYDKLFCAFDIISSDVNEEKRQSKFENIITSIISPFKWIAEILYFATIYMPYSTIRSLPSKDEHHAASPLEEPIKLKESSSARIAIGLSSDIADVADFLKSKKNVESDSIKHRNAKGSIDDLDATINPGQSKSHQKKTTIVEEKKEPIEKQNVSENTDDSREEQNNNTSPRL
ncbi:MAG: YopT-type cysteine protease domain-containing protein [Legionellaceae bacterium]|nr:YopT-type cysteine protease domain-containing protein [Legionellaceae bacterium]